MTSTTKHPAPVSTAPDILASDSHRSSCTAVLHFECTQSLPDIDATVSASVAADEKDAEEVRGKVPSLTWSASSI